MKRLLKGQRGSTFIELLIALLLIGLIGGGLLLAVSTATKAGATSDELATAESLARSIMESVKAQPYAGSYTATVPADYSSVGYTATVSAVPVPSKLGLQKITVSVFHGGGNPVMTLEGYKSNR